MLREITKAQQKAETAAEEAQKAYDLASEAKNRSLGEMERVDTLTENIDSYMSDDKATPEQVQELAEEVGYNSYRMCDESQLRVIPKYQ